MTLTLSLLGAFQASLNDSPINKFRSNRVQALLIYLAVEQADIPHQRDKLLDLFWPRMPQKPAQNNLRQTIYQLRQAIPDHTNIPFIITTRKTVQRNPDYPLYCDIAHFDALSSPASANWQEAVGLYKGDFLEDFYLPDAQTFEAWAAGHRAAYRRQLFAAYEKLIAAEMKAGRFDSASQHARRQLQHDTLREAAHYQLIQALALSGQRTEALRQYESCRRILAEEFGSEPSAKTTDLYQKILDGDLRFDAPLARGVRGYDLGELIGQGAFGTVHRATQPQVERQVAVKVIRGQYANDPNFILRFEAEAQLVGRLEHPHIVPLYDYWRDPTGAYLIMRYLPNGNLETALENGPWEMKPILKLVEQISSALSFAHHHGVIHRDIKPSNILLDQIGNAYLSDFGIAKDLQAERQLTADGEMIGTPSYISPEQIKNEAVSPQTDIYSLGLILYEVLTGEKPFSDSANMGNLILQHINNPIPLIQTKRPDLPGQIDDVIQRATAKKPSDRYADALEMAEAFRAVLQTASVTVEPITHTVLTSVVDVANPYKGLRAFQEADANLFFGRKALIQQLVSRLDPAAKEGTNGRFLAVVGPSGSGKSSVVKAGLIPALRREAVPGSDKWFVAEMVPGAFPLEELELALWPIAVDPPPSLVEPMQHNVRGMLRTIRRILPGREEAKLLLVIDQFEELFTLVADNERRTFFIDSLLTALRDQSDILRVVITLRADFYDRPLQIQALGQLLKQHTEIILPLTTEELTQAIREPAMRAGARLEEGLPEAIIAEVVDQPGALPLMQYALTELFEKSQNQRMSLKAYEEIGGVSGALSRRADEIFEGLDQSGQEATRQLFLRLINLGEGVEDTRRRVQHSELDTLNRESNHTSQSPIESRLVALLPTVIDSFGAARLLTFDRDPVTRESTVEVAHEALLRAWPRLRGWLEQSRNDIRLQRLLAVAADEWQTADRDIGFLLQGSRLDQFDIWANDTDLALTQLESDFLAQSLEERRQREAEEEERRQRELETARKLAATEKARAEVESKRAREQAGAAQRFRRLTAVLALLLILAIGASLWAWQQERRIAQQTRLATARELAAAAQSNLPLDPERSMLLALEAVKTTYAVDQTVVPEVETVLHQSVSASHVLHTLLGHDDISQASSWVTDVAFHPNGTQLATASGDNTVKVWDVESGKEVLSMTGDESPFGFWGVAYSQDGSLIAAGSSNTTVIMWDAQTGEKLNVLAGPSGHTEIINRLAFSPDGQHLASAAFDGTVRIWNLTTNQIAGIYSEIEGAPWDVAYSPDGTQIVTGGDNKLITVRGDPNQPVLRLAGHDAGVLGIAMSPDGTLIASGSSDGTARIWNLAEQRTTHTITGHGDAVWEVAFSPDGSRLATGSADGTARIWNLATGKQRMVLAGHTDAVLSVAFDPSGKFLATASKDQTARIWDLTPDHELFAFESGVVYDLAVSADETLLATTSAYGTATLWDMTTGEALRTVGEHDGPLDIVEIHIEGSRIPVGVALSANGKYLAVGNDRGRTTIWDVETGEEVRTLIGHRDAVNGLVFSPDSRQLATTSEDMTARVWNVATGEELLTLEGHKEWVWRVFFSPDGSQIVTTSPDDTAILWDSSTGARLRTFSGHTDKVAYAAFSPDGASLATASGDGTVKIWGLEDETTQTLSGHSGAVNGVAYSPDGTRLVTASADGTMRVWDSATGAELITLSTFPVGVSAVFFSRDGTELISAHGDNSVRISTLSLDRLIDLAQQRLTRNLSTEECQRFLHVESCPSE